MNLEPTLYCTPERKVRSLNLESILVTFLFWNNVSLTILVSSRKIGLSQNNPIGAKGNQDTAVYMY